MEIRKSFLIGIFLLGVLSFGFVCAADDASLDDMQGNASGEIAIEDCQSDTDKLSTSLEDSDSQPGESDTVDKEDPDIQISCPNTIYPWTWRYLDYKYWGIDIYFSFWETNPTGNTTVYLDDEVVYQGEFLQYLLEEDKLWQHYNGNGRHTVKVVYSGDDNYNPATKTCDFELDAYCCNIEDDSLVFELSSAHSGVLTVKANGRTILTRYIEATYARAIGLHSEIYRFALEGLDSGANLIEVSFTSDNYPFGFTSDIYSFVEYFEYYNPASNNTVPNTNDNTSDSSIFHREVRAGSDSKVSAGDVVAGNPLLVLALALSVAVLLPRRK